MMAWQEYKLVFRLRSSLHVGYRKTGNLMQTRGYVPGRLLWAGLTARLTRDAGHGHIGQQYVAIGDAVSTHFRFGYLYPALPKSQQAQIQSVADLTIHYPWENPLFDYRFLDSYASTALNYDFQAADEGSLHETEFVRPYARPLPGDVVAPHVYLVGSLYTTEPGDTALANWKTALRYIQLGGERTYGWGRVELVQCHPSGPLINTPIARPHAGKILAHALAADTCGRKAVTHVTGPIEPLGGWERDNKNSDRVWQLSSPTICYVPGATAIPNTPFTIGAYGIWEAAT